MSVIKVDIKKHDGATINGNALKIEDILDAITESIKDHLITKSFRDSSYNNFKDFTEAVPFEEMTIESFDLSVGDEGDFPLEEGVYSKVVKALGKIKGIKVKEDWDNAPPVTCKVTPRAEGDDEKNDYCGYEEE